MSKYIKGFNSPYLKFESGNVTRVININEIVEIMYYADNAYIYYKSRLNHELNIATAKEIDEFLMNHKTVRLPMVGGIEMDVDMMHEEQTLLEWLNENGQA